MQLVIICSRAIQDELKRKVERGLQCKLLENTKSVIIQVQAKWWTSEQALNTWTVIYHLPALRYYILGIKLCIKNTVFFARKNVAAFQETYSLLVWPFLELCFCVLDNHKSSHKYAVSMKLLWKGIKTVKCYWDPKSTLKSSKHWLLAAIWKALAHG